MLFFFAGKSFTGSSKIEGKEKWFDCRKRLVRLSVGKWAYVLITNINPNKDDKNCETKTFCPFKLKRFKSKLLKSSSLMIVLWNRDKEKMNSTVIRANRGSNSGKLLFFQLYVMLISLLWLDSNASTQVKKLIFCLQTSNWGLVISVTI